MSKFVVGFVAVACVMTVSAFGQNKVVFDNQSGDAALVKLIGPTATEVQVPNGAKQGVDAAAGKYTIKVRYGTPGNYRYTKGDAFTVTETSTARSEVTITLHKVVAGNYESMPISETEFGAALKSTAVSSTNAPPVTTSKYMDNIGRCFKALQGANLGLSADSLFSQAVANYKKYVNDDGTYNPEGVTNLVEELTRPKP